MNKTDAPWWREVQPGAWKSLFAAGAGWMLDGMDVMLFAYLLSPIKKEFGLTDQQAGLALGVSLLAASIGGAAFGFLADRFGRVRMLMASILTFSVFTALLATSQSFVQLLVWRTLLGFGMGGEWSAGSVLVAESWPDKHRGKAIGIMQSGFAIGVIFAALLAAQFESNWRPAFLIGLAPALLLVWIRRNLKEAPRPPRPAGHAPLAIILKPPYFSRAILATLSCSCLLAAYWGFFTWMPSFLARPVKDGGAGLGILKSLPWVIPMQVGAFLGYASFGLFADRFGRKPAFFVFVLAAAVVIPIFGLSARDTTVLMIVGPFVGFFGHGYFSVFGALLAELFPTAIRGAAQGACYNLGRAFSAVAPFAIGALVERLGLGPTLACSSGLFVLGALFFAFLPETRGKALE